MGAAIAIGILVLALLTFLAALVDLFFYPNDDWN